MKKYLVLSVSNYFKKKIKNKNFFFIKKKNQFNIKLVKKINPELIFVPHWNWKISDEICSLFKVIIFHSTPLPYGRGGTPIQNMIQRGFINTKICAIEANPVIDSGRIFLKRNLSLKGDVNSIYQRMYKVINDMIFFLKKKLPSPVPQTGKVVYFKRRKSEDSEISNIKSFKDIYNYIRMLDVNVKDFPKAYIETKYLKIYFTKPQIINKKIYAKAVINLK